MRPNLRSPLSLTLSNAHIAAPAFDYFAIVITNLLRNPFHEDGRYFADVLNHDFRPSSTSGVPTYFPIDPMRRYYQLDPVSPHERVILVPRHVAKRGSRGTRDVNFYTLRSPTRGGVVVAFQYFTEPDDENYHELQEGAVLLTPSIGRAHIPLVFSVFAMQGNMNVAPNMPVSGRSVADLVLDNNGVIHHIPLHGLKHLGKITFHVVMLFVRNTPPHQSSTTYIASDPLGIRCFDIGRERRNTVVSFNRPIQPAPPGYNRDETSNRSYYEAPPGFMALAPNRSNDEGPPGSMTDGAGPSGVNSSHY